jgi:hypothetical protein
MFKWITALGTEEVAIVPVFAECHDVFPQDGRSAVLAFGSEEFMPVEVTIKAKPFVSIVPFGFPRKLFQDLANFPAFDPV